MKQNKLGLVHGSVINIYIVYKLNGLRNSEDTKIRNIFTPDFTAQNCLFGALKITKDADNSKYKYYSYGVCFDSGSDFVLMKKWNNIKR